MVDFKSLKKSSGNLDRLTKEIEKLNSNEFEKQNDDRFWRPEVDKSGTGFAVIRFLPAPAVDGDDALPWARLFRHGFKGPTGKWYIENSLTTLKQKDPVAEFNSELWNQSSDDNSWQRKQVRDQKRKLTYISNILVISDPKHPENEGKIFLYRYGKKIFDKISQLTDPEFEHEKPVNPFDFWNGCNFNLKIRTVAGFLNYDASSFANPSPLSDDDAALEKIWKSEYSLKEHVAPNQFKSYDELRVLLNAVLGEKPVGRRSSSVDSLPRGAANSTRQKVNNEEDTPFEVDDEDPELAEFKNLALS